MRNSYEPPTDPQGWPAFGRAYPARDAGDPQTGYDWDPDYLARSGGPADEARDQGLRRLSMLTLHATGLSVVAAIGFATVFASTALAPAGPAPPPPPPRAPPPPPAPPPRAPTPTHHKKKKKHHHPAAAAPATSAAAPAAPPPPTLAPPANAPAPAPPSPAPPQATSSGSVPA